MRILLIQNRKLIEFTRVYTVCIPYIYNIYAHKYIGLHIYASSALIWHVAVIYLYVFLFIQRIHELAKSTCDLDTLALRRSHF